MFAGLEKRIAVNSIGSNIIDRDPSSVTAIKHINISRAATIFILATLYFYLLLFTLLPFIRSKFVLNPAVYWFIIGYALFIPLFVLALSLAAREGYNSFPQILRSLNTRSLTGRDWKYAIISTVAVLGSSGLIFGASALLHRYLGVRELDTTPWFMEMQPFRGNERFLLLVWLPMFAFNIFGEELLWRGYIQSRLKIKRAWIICSLLWLIFHLPFGWDVMMLAVPAIIILPYAFSKTHNTMVGVVIHGLYNGPIFVLIALGVLQ